MGQYDRNNYIIEVKLKDNVSDRRFDAIKCMKPSIKEFKLLQSKLLSDYPTYSKKAEELIKFFVEYRNGSIKPDRFNGWEPVNKLFDENHLEKPISMLAFPGGEVYLKKLRCVDVIIRNETFAFVWIDGEYMEPKVSLPEYLTTITVFFPKKKNTDLDFIIQLMKDIKEAFGADNGKVYYQATGEVIAE